jgi:predicted enzyme related to lactoylglutathione lyase
MSVNAFGNAPVWHELMSSDPGGATKFYSAVLGWTTAPIEGAPFPYTLWVREGAPIGGLVSPRPDQPGWPSGSTPHWVAHFQTEDVDRAANRTKEMGGVVLVPPIDIPNFGRAAVLKDPEGAVFGVFSRKS